jgi:hypothetical protein
MSVDHRLAAQQRVAELTALLQSTGDPGNSAIVAECEALARAIAAFHMEGIRFRMYNVDRLLRLTATPADGATSLPPAATPEGAVRLLEDARKHLEAAGFHTRSHQSPL